MLLLYAMYPTVGTIHIRDELMKIISMKRLPGPRRFSSVTPSLSQLQGKKQSDHDTL